MAINDKIQDYIEGYLSLEEEAAFESTLEPDDLKVLRKQRLKEQGFNEEIKYVLTRDRISNSLPRFNMADFEEEDFEDIDIKSHNPINDYATELETLQANNFLDKERIAQFLIALSLLFGIIAYIFRTPPPIPIPDKIVDNEIVMNDKNLVKEDTKDDYLKEKFKLNSTPNGIELFWLDPQDILSKYSSKSKKKLLTGNVDSTATIRDGVTNKILTIFRGHTGEVNSAVFSSSEQMVLTGSKDSTAKLWNVSNSKIKKTLYGHTGAVNSAIFSNSDRMILTGSRDSTAKLWDLSGNLICTFKGHKGAVVSIDFSPDGKYILTGSNDSTAKLWDLQRGKELKTFAGHKDAVMSVGFLPNRKEVITKLWDGTVKSWDISKLEPQSFIAQLDNNDTTILRVKGKSTMDSWISYEDSIHRTNGSVGIGFNLSSTKLDIPDRSNTLEINGRGDIVEKRYSEENLEAGTLVAIDVKNNKVIKTSKAYQKSIFGIVAGANGTNHGILLEQDSTFTGNTKVAIAGRVYVKATTKNGAIKAGDLLTSSDKAGYAMKSRSHKKAIGSIIGKALTSLDKGEGLVLVLVSLQ